MATSPSDVRAGGAFVELYAKDKAFQARMKRWQRQLRGLANSVQMVGLRMIALGAVGVAGLALSAKTFASMGDELDKMSGRTGLAVEFLSKLSHAATIGGTDLASMEKGVRRLQRAAHDASLGMLEYKEAFDILGVSVVDSNGNLKETEQLFRDTVAGLARVENNTKKAALAQEIFGRSGTALLPMLKDGAEGMNALMDEAVALGIVMSTEEAKAAAELTDDMARLWAVLKRGVFIIGSKLSPALRQASRWMRDVAKAAKEWVEENRGLVITIAKVSLGLLAAGAALLLLALILKLAAIGIGVLAFAVHGLVVSLAVLNGALLFLMTPIGSAVLAVTALLLALLHLALGAKEVARIFVSSFDGMGRAMADVMASIRTALLAGDIKAAANVMWAGLRVVWESGRSFLVGTWTRLSTEVTKTMVLLAATLTSIWSDMAHGLAGTWNSLLIGMKIAQMSFTMEAQTFWTRMQTSFAQDFADIIAPLYGVSAKELRKEIGARGQREIEAVRAEAAIGIIAATQTFYARESKAAAALKKTQERIVKDLAEDLELLTKGDEAAMVAAKARVEAAKADLKTAQEEIALAARRREVYAMLAAIEEDVARGVEGAAGRGGVLPGGGELAAATTVATMFGGALQGLGFGANIQAKIENNTNETARNTEQILGSIGDIVANLTFP